MLQRYFLGRHGGSFFDSCRSPVGSLEHLLQAIKMPPTRRRTRRGERHLNRGNGDHFEVRGRRFPGESALIKSLPPPKVAIKDIVPEPAVFGLLIISGLKPQES